MIGVVVWSNHARQKAVIWCEDHNALAYLQGSESLSSASIPWPEPGDILEFETEVAGELRFARHVSMVSEQGCAALPDLLQGESMSGRIGKLRPVPAPIEVSDDNLAAPRIVAAR